ncbi:MAG: acyl-CoA dehydrogenase family protein [Solirubrobacteraceae bacterium]|jgi:alkylation response protein AidB-like acyl-CoA dehydrogenase
MTDADPGLSFALNAEQELFRQTIREFTTNELPKDYCREVEARDDFPWDLWKKFVDVGLTGVGIAEEYGGQGGGIIEQVILDEELSRTLAGLYWLLGITLFDGKTIAAVGTPEQRQRFLPQIAAGDLMCAISLTEPGGGTDVLGAMKTRARKVDGGWLINGTKIWSTLAHVADRLFLIARTNEDVEKPSHGLTVFFCDAKAEGVKATPIPKLGMRSLGSCEVQLDDVFVPDEDVLGEVDRGWRILAETLNSERIMNGANCTGALAGVLEDMVSYSKERFAFGKPIGQMQAVQHMIADTYAGLEISRLLTYRAAWLQESGRPCGVESTMAKLVASEQCFAGADRGMQILGGYGYSLEYDMQRYWRDMRLYRVAPINNEMGRNFLAESLGLPRSF